VEELRFKDIRWLPRRLRDLGEAKAVVAVFTTTACPLVRRYLPRLEKLAQEYRPRGVRFVAINVGPGDSIAAMATQALDQNISFAFVKDVDGSCVRALGVTRTPEVVILDAEQRLRYRGRIDDQFRLGGARPEPSREDLREALDDLLAGEPIEVATTPVDGCLIGTPAEPTPPETVPDFSRQVAPILQRHCQECHRPGTEAPFSLISYEDAHAMGEMISEVVSERRMPPWYASPDHRDFANQRILSSEEIRTIQQWVAGGMPLGDPDTMPEPLHFPEADWEIDEPDLVIAASDAITVQADGYMPYQYIILPYIFAHDTWVEQIEIKPSEPSVLHHCNLAYINPGKQGWRNSTFVTGRVPGGGPMHLDEGVALKIPEGAILVLQAHYQPNGKETSDRLSVGFRFPRVPVRTHIRHRRVHDNGFEIPAGAPAHLVKASKVLPHDATGIAMFSHMHLRGRDMSFDAVYPDGRRESLLVIPNYSFDWQLAYRWAPETKRFPKGTRIEVGAHFDNSPFNPFNPDPQKAVKFGPQTYHEMMYGFFFYLVDDEDLNFRIDTATGKKLP
jgi:thiol-disulfide isomerase/thioredoxin